MKTIEDIKNDSFPHPLIDGARQTIYHTPSIRISIVGGGRGLYGDFDETFEVAILEKESSKFLSDYFYPEFSDVQGDIMPHLNREQTLKVVNELVRD